MPNYTILTPPPPNSDSQIEKSYGIFLDCHITLLFLRSP